VLAVIFGLLGLAYALVAAPTDADRAGTAYMEARQSGADPLATPAQSPQSQSSQSQSPQSQSPLLQQPPASGGRPGSALGGATWTYRDRSANRP
jgi:hypothetical protein